MADQKISQLTGYTTPLDADVIPVVDTANTTNKKTTWANIKATLKTYFDTLYVNGTGVANRIAYWVDADTVGNLDTATYPSLTELSYVKGATSSIQTQLNTKAADSAVVHNTGVESIDGIKTFTSDPLIPDEAYGSGWNGVLEPPTKNAVYDKIETLSSGNVNVTNYVDVTVTNTTTETDLISLAIAGGVLSTNKSIRLRTAVSMGWNSNGSSLTLRVKYGATTLATIVYDPVSATTQTGKVIIEGIIIGAGSTSAQEANFIAIESGMTDPNSLANNIQLFTATAAEDSTASKNLKLTAQWQNTSTDLTTTMLHYLVEKMS